MRNSLDFYSISFRHSGISRDELAERSQRDCRWHSMLIGISVLKIMGLPPIAGLPLKGDYLQVLRAICADAS